MGVAEIRQHNGRPAIFINGKPYPPMMATVRTLEDDRLVVDQEYLRRLGESGVRIFFLICSTPWIRENALELFDREARMLLEAVPDAYIIPRIVLHPSNQWIEENPGEAITYTDGSRPSAYMFTEAYCTTMPHVYSLCSAKWREDAGKVLAETWRQLLALPYGDRIVGCFLAAGGTSEWYYMLPVVKDGMTLGYSDSFRRNFGWYLRETYKTDEALQKAWKREDVTLESPRIPDVQTHYFSVQADIDAAVPKEKMITNAPVPPPFGNGTNVGAFLDVDKHKDTYDFYRALHNGTAESVLCFARIIKRISPDRLVGAFYGVYGGAELIDGGTSGGTVRVLNDPNVDFLSAPGVYENRQSGGFAGQREMQDSLAIHNKIYVVEEDARTHLENRYFADKYRVYDLTDSVNTMKRGFGRTVCEDVQAWWFDQIIGGRRYKCEELYALIRRQQEIARKAYACSRKKNSEIALIYDEESVQTVSPQTTSELVELFRNYEKDCLGAPADQYFHNDLSREDMPLYKLYVFCNTLVLTEKERQAIRAKLEKDGATALFLYAPGVIDPEADTRFAEEHICDLTGIRVRRLDERFDSKFRINGQLHPMTRGLDRRKLFGIFDRIRRHGYACDVKQYWESYLYPLFYSDDPDAQVLGSFLTSGKPALTVKQTDGFTSVFCGAKFLSSALVRNIARAAGCHIYCDSDDVLYANENFVVFHAASGGSKTLRFPKTVSPWEVYEEKAYGSGVQEIRFDAYLGETKMFYLGGEQEWRSLD